VIRQRQLFLGRSPRPFGVKLQFDLKRTLLLAAIDGQDAVRRDDANRLGELKVVLVFLTPALSDVVGFSARELASVPENRAQGAADIRLFRDYFSENLANAAGDFIHRGQLFVGINESGQHFVERADGGVAIPNGQGCWLKPAFARRAGGCLPLRLKRQVQVFEPLGMIRRHQCLTQFVSELTLGFNGFENCLLPFGEVLELANSETNPLHDRFRKPAGAFTAVPRDERNGVPFVQ
jgi:hypothetical protein